MTYIGHVVDGQIILDMPIVLPNGTAVRVEPLATGNAPAKDQPGSGQPKTLREQLKNFLSHEIDLPPDASINHDDYLYRQTFE